MTTPREIVITGMGVLSPLGVGRQAFWSALVEGRSGIDQISTFDASGLPVRLAAEVRTFNPLEYVKPRKSLKVMARDTQFGMTVAGMARDDAQLSQTAVNPERFGVVFAADPINPTTDETFETYRYCVVDGELDFSLWGTKAFANSFPLGMLKLLPNMVACHVSIAHDARAHNNTLYMGNVSGLLAIAEAASVISRDAADAMLVGGASSRMIPTDWVHSCFILELSRRHDAPQRASRPFDAQRDGQVRGEGAAAMILEDRRHAERRGAHIWGRILGWGSSCDPQPATDKTAGQGLRLAIVAALRMAGVPADSIGHVNAHGVSTRDDDRIEAQVLHSLLPDTPVTALKSYFGNLFSASGVVELSASLLGLAEGFVPATLNYEHPDPQCPVNVIRGAPLRGAAPFALAINRTPNGQAAAMVIGPA